MSFFEEINGGSVMTVRRSGDLMLRAISSKASRYYICRVIDQRRKDHEKSETHSRHDQRFVGFIMFPPWQGGLARV